MSITGSSAIQDSEMQCEREQVDEKGDNDKSDNSSQKMGTESSLKDIVSKVG